MNKVNNKVVEMEEEKQNEIKLNADAGPVTNKEER